VVVPKVLSVLKVPAVQPQVPPLHSQVPAVQVLVFLPYPHRHQVSAVQVLAVQVKAHPVPVAIARRQVLFPVNHRRQVSVVQVQVRHHQVQVHRPGLQVPAVRRQANPVLAVRFPVNRVQVHPANHRQVAQFPASHRLLVQAQVLAHRRQVPANPAAANRLPRYLPLALKAPLRV